MVDFLNGLAGWLGGLVGMSVTAAWAAAVITLLWLVLRRRAPRWVCAVLWLVVFARLLVPVSFHSPVSAVPSVVAGLELPDGAGPAPDPAASQPAAPGETVPAVPTAPAAEDPAASAGPGPGSSTAPAESRPSEEPVISTNPVAPIPDPVAAPAFTWRTALAGLWLLGAAAMVGYALFSYFRLRRTVYDAVRTEPGVWEHPALRSPFLLGVGRPKVYLPTGLTGDTRAFVLAHERAHIRRGDWLVKPLCWLALSLHWFNPMAWVAFALMGADMEAACDQAVLRQLGEGVRADYSAALLAFAVDRRKVPAPCPLAFGEGSAKGRIKGVLNYRRPAFWVVLLAVAAAVAAAVCLLTDPIARKADEPTPPPERLPLREASIVGSLDRGAKVWVIRADGMLVTWGEPEYGETIPMEEPLEVLENAAAVYSGGDFTILCIDRQGRLWTVGPSGLESDGDFDRYRVSYITDNVADASFLAGVGYALKADRSLWMWGKDPVLPGEFREGYMAPEKVMDDIIDMQIFTPGSLCVVKSDYTVWAWSPFHLELLKLCEGVRELGGSSVLGVDGVRYQWDPGAYDQPVTLGEPVEDRPGGNSLDFRLEDGDLWAYAEDGREPRLVASNVAEVTYNEEEYIILKRDGTLLRVAIEPGGSLGFPYDGVVELLPIKGLGWEGRMTYESSLLYEGRGVRVADTGLGSFTLYDEALGRTFYVPYPDTSAPGAARTMYPAACDRFYWMDLDGDGEDELACVGSEEVGSLIYDGVVVFDRQDGGWTGCARDGLGLLPAGTVTSEEGSGAYLYTDGALSCRIVREEDSLRFTADRMGAESVWTELRNGVSMGVSAYRGNYSLYTNGEGRQYLLLRSTVAVLAGDGSTTDPDSEEFRQGFLGRFWLYFAVTWDGTDLVLIPVGAQDTAEDSLYLPALEPGQEPAPGYEVLATYQMDLNDDGREDGLSVFRQAGEQFGCRLGFLVDGQWDTVELPEEDGAPALSTVTDTDGRTVVLAIWRYIGTSAGIARAHPFRWEDGKIVELAMPELDGPDGFTGQAEYLADRQVRVTVPATGFEAEFTLPDGQLDSAAAQPEFLYAAQEAVRTVYDGKSGLLLTQGLFGGHPGDYTELGRLYSFLTWSGKNFVVLSQWFRPVSQTQA